MKLSSTSKWAIACSALLLTSLSLATGIVMLNREKSDMEEQLERLKASDKKSFIVKQISQQMEEIANGQKEISDKRRIEAEAQTLIAENMRMRADDERRNALVAEEQAIEASKVAQREQREADEQRRLAETSRNQAVAEKNRADTLAYIALGRSLAIKSAFQYNAGNHNIARMLAYYSWLFTTRYGGNVYDGVVFTSLINANGSYNRLELAKSPITSLASNKDDNYLTTKYGEVKKFSLLTPTNVETNIFSDVSYDFRDGLISQDGEYWAIDVNGRLKNFTTKNKDATLSGKRFFRLLPLGKSNICAISESSIYVIPTNNAAKATLVATGSYTASGRHGNSVDIATSTGKIITIGENAKVTKTSDPLNFGKITAMAWTKGGMAAYGNAKGEILIVNGNVKMTIKAHKSVVSRLIFNDGRLYSAGYDGNVFMWNIRGNKYESTTLASESSWIHYLDITNDGKRLFLSLESGNVVWMYINPNEMVKRIRQQIKGNMSVQDWNYYIGSQIPYEKI